MPTSQIPPDYYFRVTYEFPPTRAIHYADFDENGMDGVSDDELRYWVERQNPDWRVKKIERMLRGVQGWVSRDDG